MRYRYLTLKKKIELKIQKVMKKTLIMLSVLALAVACKDNSRFPGYDLLETGSYFKMEKEGEGKTAIKQGDVVFIHYTMTNEKDSVIYDYKTMSRPGQPYAMRLSQPSYKGDMFEMIYKMKVGDSASFALRIDSMFDRYYRQPVPNFLDPKGYLVYHLKVDSLINSAKVDSIEKQQRQMQEAYIEKARLSEDSLIKKYLADNKVNVKPTESGLYIVIKEKGKGPKVKKGDNVEVSYKGMLTSGQVFDASDRHDQAFVFPVGMQQVIPAWDEALENLTVGTKATLICPSKMCYGPSGQGPIPPYAPLVFELDVISIKTPPAPNK
jgi:FKBP-type peptidyl-prolyl cis-trans isomerase FkpA